MKRLKSTEAYKLISGCFLLSLTWLLCYELWWTKIASHSDAICKIGIISAHIFYSTLAASIFYYISIYLPRQRRKIKILYNVYQKTFIIDILIQRLEFNLNNQQNGFQLTDEFTKTLQSINPDKPVRQFLTWHLYLLHLKNKLLDIIRSMTIYNDYLNADFLQELILLEKHLLSPDTFDGFKTTGVTDLTYAETPLRELLVHNKHLQELREKEFKKYEKQLKEDGDTYRQTYYKDSDKK